jgi:hypothetical protein
MQPREIVVAVMGWNWERGMAETVEAIIIRQSQAHFDKNRLT